MKILFMGTDQFAVPSLEALAEKHTVRAVITRPDKPRGRGQKVSPTPVKDAAIKLGIPVFEPKNLKSSSFKEEILKLDFELVVLVAFGRLLPEEFLDIPERGSICLHPSMLPEYRGCSPIECAILDGRERTGISVFFIEKDVDSGDIIYQEEFEIMPDDTGGTLRKRLSEESPRVLLRALKLIETGCDVAFPQKAEHSSYAPKVCKEDALIDWRDAADVINNKIRAYNPKPGAHTYFRGKTLKILKAAPINKNSDCKPGTIIGIEKNKGIIVACGQGSLLLTEVQPEGRKPMNVSSFSAGHRPYSGERMTLQPEELPDSGQSMPVVL